MIPLRVIDQHCFSARFHFNHLVRAGLGENDRLIEVDDENVEGKSTKGDISLTQ